MPVPQALIDLFIQDFPATPKAKTASTAKPKKPDFSVAKTKEEYLAESRYWKPVAAVYHIARQTCQCCGEVTEILGSILIKHENPRQKASWECRRSTLESHQNLPIEFVEHPETVERCPRCLRAEAVICDFPATHPHQQSLFNH